MCEECESDEGLAQSYAQKRARMRAYWTPKRKPFGLTATEAHSRGTQDGEDTTRSGRTTWISDSKTKLP